MKPYYEHGGITIYHRDCREVLPELSCDVIVTDPPYGIGLENHAAGRERRSETYEITGDADKEIGQLVCDYAAGKDLPLVIFASPWQPWRGTWRNLIVWDKGGAVGGGGDTEVCLKRTWELIQTTRTSLWGQRSESVIRRAITPQETQLHIAQKPVDLMAWLIGKFAHPNDTLVDPCCGSGSTLEAAKWMNRRAIGIEIEEKYCEIAAKRLSQEVFDFGNEHKDRGQGPVQALLEEPEV